MEGPTYKGREVKGGRGKRMGEGPPVITVSTPGSRSARIVTGCVSIMFLKETHHHHHHHHHRGFLVRLLQPRP